MDESGKLIAIIGDEVGEGFGFEGQEVWFCPGSPHRPSPLHFSVERDGIERKHFVIAVLNLPSWYVA